jgi:hypothetical protein
MKKAYKSPELTDRGSATTQTLEGMAVPPEGGTISPDKGGPL